MPSTLYEIHSGHMAASFLLEEALAVTAEFTREIFRDNVSSVITDNVVQTVAQKLNATRFHKFACFLVHDAVT